MPKVKDYRWFHRNCFLFSEQQHCYSRVQSSKSTTILQETVKLKTRNQPNFEFTPAFEDSSFFRRPSCIITLLFLTLDPVSIKNQQVGAWISIWILIPSFCLKFWMFELQRVQYFIFKKCEHFFSVQFITPNVWWTALHPHPSATLKLNHRQ